MPQPLSTQEFTVLRQQLHDDELALKDLTGPNEERIIEYIPQHAQSNCIDGETGYDNDEARLRLPAPDRLRYLLGRGLLLALGLQHWTNLGIQQPVKDDAHYHSELYRLHTSTMPHLLHHAGNVDLLNQPRQTIWVEVKPNEFPAAQALAAKLAIHMEKKPRIALINLETADGVQLGESMLRANVNIIGVTTGRLEQHVLHRPFRNAIMAGTAAFVTSNDPDAEPSEYADYPLLTTMSYKTIVVVTKPTPHLETSPHPDDPSR